MPDPADRGPEPQPPVFPGAEAAALQLAIDALAAELERVASCHELASGSLTSWSGRGVRPFLRDLGDGIDDLKQVAQHLRDDIDTLAGHQRLHQTVHDTYVADHQRWAATP